MSSISHGPADDPTGLVAELDALIQDQAQLRERAKALHSKFTALRSRGQFLDGFDAETGDFVASSVDIEFAGRNLGSWIFWSVQTRNSLNMARECAGRVREAPQTQEHGSDRRRSR